MHVFGQGCWRGLNVGVSAPVHLMKGMAWMLVSFGVDLVQAHYKFTPKTRRWGGGSMEGRSALALHTLTCSSNG